MFTLVQTTNRVAGENVANFELCELWLFPSLSSMRKQLSTTNSKGNEGRQEKNGGVNTLTAKDGDLRLSAPNACLPKKDGEGSIIVEAFRSNRATNIVFPQPVGPAMMHVKGCFQRGSMWVNE